MVGPLFLYTFPGPPCYMLLPPAIITINEHAASMVVLDTIYLACVIFITVDAAIMDLAADARR